MPNLNSKPPVEYTPKIDIPLADDVLYCPCCAANHESIELGKVRWYRRIGMLAYVCTCKACGAAFRRSRIVEQGYVRITLSKHPKDTVCGALRLPEK